MSHIRSNELTRIIQDAVLSCDKSAREVAREIDKPYPTLLREINPEDLGAKVGVETLEAIMRATGNVRPLAYLAGAMGYALTPLEVETRDPEGAMFMALDLMSRLGIFSEALKQAMGGGDVSGEEVCKVERAGCEAISTIMTVSRYLRLRMAEPAPDLHLAAAG